MSSDIWKLDATAQAELVRNRKISPSELVDLAIGRIERLNPQINAVILPAFERARRQARQLDGKAAAAGQPFYGVPFLMKDLGGEEAGAPCHRGVAALKQQAGATEKVDSFTAARFREAGFISLGRTNTPEYGLQPTTEPLAYGPTRNPWNVGHSSGGSSGGSAAAVAAGMVAAAHASDGGGSIRIPASHCGLVGLKPTRARGSFGPNAGERWGGFSCELVVTRSVRDTAAILDVYSGNVAGDPYWASPPAPSYREVATQPLKRLRIGILSTSPRDGLVVDEDCTAAATRTAKLLADLGHEVVESHPDALGDLEGLRAFATVVACNITRLLEVLETRLGRPLQPGDVEPLTAAVAEMGRSFSASTYLAAIDTVHAIGRRTAAWWNSGFDLLLTPTAALPPPPLGSMAAPADDPLSGWMKAAPYGSFTSIFNLSGQPAISLPIHHTSTGLPVGAQLVAAFGREDLLLQIAAAIEQAAPWADRWPAIAGD